MQGTGRIFDVDVLEVHSGDDLVLMVSLGVDGLYKKVRARLQGVDTPDGYKEEHATEAGQVRDNVRRILNGRSCTIELHSERKSSWIVTLYLPPDSKGTKTSINQYLINNGYVFKGIGNANGKSA